MLFLCPGKAIQEENDSSSSKDIHNLLLSGIFFLVNFIHSDPGFASSLKYSFGRELSISIPLLINNVMNVRLMKCAKRSQRPCKSVHSSTFFFFFLLI
jgi:hypothetical protein